MCGKQEEEIRKGECGNEGKTEGKVGRRGLEEDRGAMSGKKKEERTREKRRRQEESVRKDVYEWRRV